MVALEARICVKRKSERRYSSLSPGGSLNKGWKEIVSGASEMRCFLLGFPVGIFSFFAMRPPPE